MLPEAKILLSDVERSYGELVRLIEHLREYVRGNMLNVSEITDIAFVTREVDTNTKEFSRRINELHREASATVCTVLAMTGQEIVRTDYCSATSNPKPWFRIPYKRDANPDQWDEIMVGIGVSDLANKKDLVRIHAPAFMDYCGELIAEGGQPPAGVNPKEMTGMELNLRITKKRS